MLRAGGYGHQIGFAAEQLIDAIAQVQAEQTLPLDEEAHFILGVGVLAQELLTERILLGMVRGHVYRIDREVAALGLQTLDFRGVGGEYVVVAGVRSDRPGSLPALEADARRRQGRLNQCGILGVLEGLGRLGFIKDCQTGHGWATSVSFDPIGWLPVRSVARMTTSGFARIGPEPVAVMNLAPALPTFFVTLREGVEAALVVGIVLGCLDKAGANQLRSQVWQGVGAGLLASLGVGLGLSGALTWVSLAADPYAPVWRLLLEAGFCGVAIAFLSWMLIWMTRQARSLKGEVESQVRSALAQQSGAAIFGLVFIAVLREGFETVVFILARLQQGGLVPSLGAIAGLLGATLIGLLIFRGGVRLDLRRFFQVMGTLLLLIVAGLAVSLLRKLDLAAALMAGIGGPDLCWGTGPACLLGPQVWNWQAQLPDARLPGLLLKTLFGYRDQIYLLQAVAWSLLLLGVGGLYRRSLND